MMKKILLLLLLSVALSLSSAYATKTVTNCADDVSYTGSLRWAMANAGAGELIDFNIPTSDPSYEASLGVWRISINSTLPTITVGGVYINGSTQTVNQGDNNLLGPEIMISAEASPIDGIYFNSSNNTVEGLVINNFNGGTAVYIQNGNSNTIRGCYLGTDPTGSYDASNPYNNISIYGGKYNLIGGNTTEARNLISGANNAGIFIFDNYGDSSSNEVKGNYIGTDRTGGSAIPNSYGVQLNSGSSGCKYNIIGGSGTGEGNVISGNSQQGVSISNGSNSNEVKGNYVGINAQGDSAVPNYHGIYIDFSSDRNIIGGSSISDRNIISGNTDSGIYLNGANNTEIKGNYIGTDPSGISSLNNHNNGIYLNQSNANNIGGLAAGEGNLISGNSYYGAGQGVNIQNQSSYNQIRRNRIGTSWDGEGPSRPNGHGIQIGGSGTVAENYNTVEGNVISGNSLNGINLFFTGGYNDIRNNYIGVSASGGPLPNNQSGIYVDYAYPTCYLTSNEVRNNGNYGIYYNVPGYSSATLSCESNNVRANGNYGLFINDMANTSQVIFHNGTLEGNSVYQGTIYEVYNGSTTVIADCQNTDWRSPNGPYDAEDERPLGRWYNPAGLGGRVSDYVDYRYFPNWGMITPETPSNLIGTAETATTIRWSWQDNTTWESTYQIRDEAGTLMMEAPRNATTTVETGLAPATRYIRFVNAWKIDTTSEASATAEATTPNAVGPIVTLITPIGGEKWRTENSNTVEFTAADPDGLMPNSVDIYASLDSGVHWGSVATGRPTNESFTLPPVPPSYESSHVRMRVTARDIYSNVGTGESASDFLIDGYPPTLEVIAPNGGESISGASSTYRIRWLASDSIGLPASPITYIKFSSDNGATWSNVAASLTNSGSYEWTVPSVNSDQCLISMEAVDQVGHRTTKESASVFSIDSNIPTILSVSPTAGATDVAGTAEVVINFSEAMSKEAVEAAFSLTASPPVTGTFTWNTSGSQLTFKPTSFLSRSTTYTISVGTGACDPAGNHLASAFSSTFTTKIGGPRIVIKEDTNALINGDYIPGRPKFNAVITSSTSLDVYSAKMSVDNAPVSPTITLMPGNILNAFYQPAADLADETVTTHAISVEVLDVENTRAVKELTGLKVSVAGAPVVLTNPIIYPTPFNPAAQGVCYITYDLNRAASVRVDIYNPMGEIVWRKEFSSGNNGGKAGPNSVEFKGWSSVTSATLANGMYLVRIIADGKAAGKTFVIISQ